MAERRRRRRLSEEESGEEVSEDVKDTKVPVRPSECESEDEHLVEDVEVSDYESVTEGKEPGEEAAAVEEEEEEEEEDDDDESEEESESDSEEESEESSSEEDDDESDGGVDYVDGDGLEEERQSGDGEEQPGEEKNKELDDDEDRRNPAYVPRRGAFYEHDTRITEDAEKEQQRLAPKKKLWKDEGKWQHDRFHEDQQAPKSREELMVIYGYDILASDQPPAAAPRINKSRVRNPQRRQQLKDFMGDPKWSGRRTSPDVQQKNYRNRRPTRGGGRSRLGDYSDSRREYNRHEVIESRRDHGDVRRDYIDNRGDAEENRKDEEVAENKVESSENCHVLEESKVDVDEKVSTDGHHFKKELSENSKEVSEVMKKDHFEKRREYVDNRKDYGNNRRDSGDSRRDSGDSRRDSGDSRRDYMDNRRDYSDTNTSANVTWKVQNYVGRSHSNGEVKSNHSFRSNHKSTPPRPFTNANYRGENSESTKTDSEKFSVPAFKKSPENNSNYKNIEPTNYRGGSSDVRSYKSSNHEPSHRNNIIDNRSYRNIESNSGYYRNNNESKQRTPDRNFSHEEVVDSLSKQKGAILNNVEFSGSVVTANNSMEKKSYSKERRIKGIARTRMQPVLPHETAIESERNSFTSDKSTQQQEGKLEINTGPSKAENVTRPKRYSTQRQRNVSEVNYPDQIPVDGTTYYSPNFTQGPPHMFHPDQVPSTHQEGAAFQPTMLQAHTPIPYTLPVSTTGIPSPPRMFGPAPVPVSIATAPPAAAMLPPQYIGAGVIYGAPPPGPYQVPVIPGYQSPPPPPQPPTSGLQELYRGGTTYYSTDLQQPSPSRSPVRRQKSAIPIINPQDMKTKESTSANDTDTDSNNCSRDNHSQDKVKEETSISTNENAVESVASAESINHKQSVSFDTPTSTDADSTSCALSKSTAATAVACKETPPSETEERETNSSSITAHKPVDMADTCTPSEQATQPILEAAA